MADQLSKENTLRSDLEGRLTMYVVYWNAIDYPGLFVLRRWHVTADSLEVDRVPVGVAFSLKAIRELVPPDSVKIPREDEDDPAIFETWV